MSRIRTNIITNRMANGAPTVSNGLVISGVTTTSDVNVGAGVTLNVYGGATYSGIITCPNVSIASSVTATTYYGSGANLTGIDATKIITGNTQVQTIDTGSDGHVKVTTEGSERLRIDDSGRVLVGHTGSLSEGTKFQIVDTSDNTAEFFAYAASTSGARLTLTKSRSGTKGTNTVVQNGDKLGEIHFRGADGTGYIRGATISAEVDGTPGTNDMPGRLTFATTADDANTQTERLRIGSAGQLGIAGANYGTSGQVLTSQGASSPIQWATLTTGKVLQMTYKRGGVTSSSNSGGWTDSVESGLNVDITPLSATSRIIIQMHSVGGNTSSGRSYFLRLRRKVNNTGDTNVASFQIGDGSNGGMQSMALTHVDYDASSPFNTSHVRNYRIRFGQDGSGTARFDYATTSVLYCLEIQ